MLALNKFPRLASTALAASLVPTTLAGHRFWEETDEQQRAQQQVHFFKNVSLLGGLMIAAADTEGTPVAGLAGPPGRPADRGRRVQHRPRRCPRPHPTSPSAWASPRRTRRVGWAAGPGRLERVGAAARLGAGRRGRAGVRPLSARGSGRLALPV